MSELKPIPEFDGYFVTFDGLVYSTRDAQDGIARLMKTRPSKKGYLQVDLMQNGKRRCMRVHRLVLLAWVGPPPFRGALGLHRNDQKKDNRASNLYWGNESDNRRDFYRNGGDPPMSGESHYAAVITEK